MSSTSWRNDAIALAVVATLYLAIPNAVPDFTRYNADDSGFYLALADNLSIGHGYTLYQPPLYAPHTLYPPLLPLVLAGAWLVGGHSLWVAKVAMILIGLVGLVVVRRVARTLLGERDATFVFWATALSPLYFAFSHQAMADMPATVLAAVSVAAITRWLDADAPLLTPAFWIAVVAVGAYETLKPQALAVLAVPMAELVLRRRAQMAALARGAAFCAVAAIPFLAWSAVGAVAARQGYDQPSQVYYDTAGGPSGDLGASVVAADLATAAAQGGMVAGALRRFRWRVSYDLGEVMLPVLSWTGWRDLQTPRGAGLLLALLMLVVPLVGAVRVWGTPARPLCLFVAFHVLLVVAVPYGGNLRYLVPVVPWLTWLCWKGVGGTLPAAGLLVVAAALPLASDVAAMTRQPYATPAWQAFADLAIRAGTDAGPSAVVLTHNWQEFHLLCGCPTAPTLAAKGMQPDTWRALFIDRTAWLVVPKVPAFASVGQEVKLQAAWYRWLEAHRDRTRVLAENEFYELLALDAVPLDVVFQTAGVAGR